MYELDIIVSKETRGATRKIINGNDIIRLKSSVNSLIEDICKETGMKGIVLFKWLLIGTDDKRIIDQDKAYALINAKGLIEKLSVNKKLLEKEIQK